MGIPSFVSRIRFKIAIKYFICKNFGQTMNPLLILKNKHLKFSNFFFQSSLFGNFEVVLVCMQDKGRQRNERQKRETVNEKYFLTEISMRKETQLTFLLPKIILLFKNINHGYSSNLLPYNNTIYFIIIILYFSTRTQLKIGFFS